MYVWFEFHSLYFHVSHFSDHIDYFLTSIFEKILIGNIIFTPILHKRIEIKFDIVVRIALSISCIVVGLLLELKFFLDLYLFLLWYFRHMDVSVLLNLGDEMKELLDFWEGGGFLHEVNRKLNLKIIQYISNFIIITMRQLDKIIKNKDNIAERK